MAAWKQVLYKSKGLHQEIKHLPVFCVIVRFAVWEQWSYELCLCCKAGSRLWITIQILTHESVTSRLVWHKNGRKTFRGIIWNWQDYVSWDTKCFEMTLLVGAELMQPLVQWGCTQGCTALPQLLLYILSFISRISIEIKEMYRLSLDPLIRPLPLSDLYSSIRPEC